MDGFKDAIFCYEAACLPPELQVVEGICERFHAMPASDTTLLQVVRSMDEAAVIIDRFKAKTCGSAYSLALININMMGDIEELKFLLRPDVLGDPRTVFLASLRDMGGANYAFAKEKIRVEAECRERTPSCLDCYSASNREETQGRVAELMAAYLCEAEDRAKAKRLGLPAVGFTTAGELLKKSHTTYYGKGLRVQPPGVNKA